MRYILPLILLLAPLPALAQPAMDRLDQMEEDIMMLKRQQERARLSGGNSGSYAPEPAADGSAAQINVRITALEEEIRNLRGRVEERDFEVRRLSEELSKMKSDVDYRLGELEHGKGGAAPVITDESVNSSMNEAPKAELAVREEAPAAAEAAPADSGQTPRDHYNYAFRLLNQNQYEEASKSFASFTKKYPGDPLIGNAYYWLGETYYIRKDYNEAANHFRQGFESMPKGPKAADNLLKLGMSLAALKKKEEACIVLAQVMTKYKTASANVAAKAQSEHNKAGCAG